MRILILLPALLVASLALAQSSPNYDCAHAIALPVALGNVQSFFAPLDGRELVVALPTPVTTCSGTVVRGWGWYSFVALQSTHWIRSEGDGVGETIDLFSGSCGSLTPVACWGGNAPPAMATGLVPGNTYYLRVLMLANCTSCFTSFAVVSAPLNDECAGALQMPVLADVAQPYPTTEISTLGATQSLPGCVGGGRRLRTMMCGTAS